MEERIPPHNLEAEQSVLGAALLSPDAMYDVLEITSADDFYDPNNKEIFFLFSSWPEKTLPLTP